MFCFFWYFSLSLKRSLQLWTTLMNLDRWPQLGYILVEQNIWWSKESQALSFEGRRWWLWILSCYDKIFITFTHLHLIEKSIHNADRQGCDKFICEFNLRHQKGGPSIEFVKYKRLHLFLECLAFVHNLTHWHGFDDRRNRGNPQFQVFRSFL